MTAAIRCPMCSGFYGAHNPLCVLYAQAAPPKVDAVSYDFRGAPVRVGRGLFGEPTVKPHDIYKHPISGVPYAVACAHCGGQGKCSCPDADPVKNPAHYTRLSPQPIDVISAWGLNFNLGNVVKYVARAGYKVPGYGLVEDLKKAADYLAREIARHEKVSTK